MKTMLEIGGKYVSLLSFLCHDTYFTILKILSKSLVRVVPFILWLTNE